MGKVRKSFCARVPLEGICGLYWSYQLLFHGRLHPDWSLSFREIAPFLELIITIFVLGSEAEQPKLNEHYLTDVLELCANFPKKAYRQLADEITKLYNGPGTTQLSNLRPDIKKNK